MCSKDYQLAMFSLSLRHHMPLWPPPKSNPSTLNTSSSHKLNSLFTITLLSRLNTPNSKLHRCSNNGMASLRNNNQLTSHPNSYLLSTSRRLPTARCQLTTPTSSNNSSPSTLPRSSNGKANLNLAISSLNNNISIERERD